MDLSLVVPVLNEEECVGEFVRRTVSVLDSLNLRWEIIFVDDGSSDRTMDLIRDLIPQNPGIRLLELSYNHGKSTALTAGISHANGKYILMMDPDLQDPPEEIPRFLEEIRKGPDLVFGVRREKRDGIFNVILSKLFWWTLERFTGLSIPRGLAVMRIFNRRFAEQFLKYGEENRFLEGLFMHVGMKQETILIEQKERFAGKSKFTIRRKFQLAFSAILDFSELPLRFGIRFGLYLTLFGFLGAVYVVIQKLFFIDYQLGWPSIMVVLLMGIGLQIFFVGIAAIYIGRIYKETKNRPLFSIRSRVGFNE